LKSLDYFYVWIDGCAPKLDTVSPYWFKDWYIKDGIKNFLGDFTVEDELRAGRSQKIETDELQALLDINSAQTEKELAE